MEDDQAVVALVRSALGQANALITAGEGEQALELVRGQSFDLVLCDLRMPGMSGREFYGALERDSPELARQLLFISGS